MSVEEEEWLLKECQTYLNGQLIEIVTFALHTGCRQGEIVNLKWSDIDLFRRTITISKTKNKQVKTVPMTNTVFNLLLAKSKVKSMAGFIFRTENDTPIRQRNLIREWYKVIKKAGLEGFRFHDLRHTATSRMVQSGIDLYCVAKILGHKSVVTTQRYAHHNPESLRAGVKVLDNFGGGVIKKDIQNG